MTSKAAKAKGAERKQRMDTSSLMEQILSKDNLNAAYLQVVRNKGAAGVDGMSVEELGAYDQKEGRQPPGGMMIVFQFAPPKICRRNQKSPRDTLSQGLTSPVPPFSPAAAFPSTRPAGP